MSWKIEYPYEDVEQFILELPSGLAARYIHLTELMIEFGSNLGMPHTKSISGGLFELRIKGQEGIARVFYCTRAGKRVAMLHGYIKKSQKTPRNELRRAESRLLEVKKNEA